MGLISWLSNQWEALDLATETVDTILTPPTPRINEGPGLKFPEFEDGFQEHIQSEVDAFVDQLSGVDAKYGQLLTKALRNDGVVPPAIPEDVLRIQRLLGSPECDVPLLATAITKDAAIAGRFVGIANSPLYARADKVKTVEDAVVRIGLRQTSMIVMAIVSKTKLFRAPGFERQARDLHRRCLASAVVGQLLAREVGIFEGNAFMGGLIQDIGRIWLWSLSAELTRKSRGDLRVSEATVTSVSDRFHASFGALVAESWGFEDELLTAIRLHHAPQTVEDASAAISIPSYARTLTFVLAVGDVVGRSIVDASTPDPVLTELCAAIDVDVDADLRHTASEAFLAFEQQLS